MPGDAEKGTYPSLSVVVQETLEDVVYNTHRDKMKEDVLSSLSDKGLISKG